MSLLVTPDTAALYLPGELDAHGWREGPPEGSKPWWSGRVNLQLVVGGVTGSSAQGTDAGGRGPHDPATIRQGTLYLPPGVEPPEGATAVVRGRAYVLSQVRVLVDPRGISGGGIDCITATATEARHG